MRYLKSYKKFETIGYTELTDEIWEDIDDILLELVDVGFFISKDISDVKRIDNKLCEGVIEIIIDHSKPEEYFSFSKIEENVRRLVKYMTEKGWNYSLMCFIGPNLYGGHSFHTFECGGSHHLAKIKKTFKGGSEEALPKGLRPPSDLIVNAATKKTSAFKIAFYQNIARIIE